LTSRRTWTLVAGVAVVGLVVAVGFEASDFWFPHTNLISTASSSSSFETASFDQITTYCTLTTQPGCGESTTISFSSNTNDTGDKCIVTMASPLVIYVKISSSRSPVVSLPVSVSERAFQDTTCGPGPLASLGVLFTDAVGSISVCCTADEFFFNFTFGGMAYNFNETANGAESAECVTVSVPSFNITIAYSPIFHTSCNRSYTVRCQVQNVAVYSVLVVSTSDSSTYTSGSMKTQTTNISEFTTETVVSESSGYEWTTTYSAASSQTISGEITEWTQQGCTYG
jgi:hypothetical protein